MLSEDNSASHLLAAFGDGMIRRFDRRLDEDNAVVGKYQEHTSWVQNVRWHPHNANYFLSARFVLDTCLCHETDGITNITVWMVKSNFGTYGTTRLRLCNGTYLPQLAFPRLMYMNKQACSRRML